MLASSEAQAGIENDHLLLSLWLQFAPTRFNQKRVADLDRFEMFFPGLGPVFPGQDTCSQSPEVEATIPEQRQPFSNLLLQCTGPLLWIDISPGGNAFRFLDLCYTEDVAASVDLNVVMNDKNEFIELQGTGEESTFSPEQLTSMLELGRSGIQQLLELQKQAIAS